MDDDATPRVETEADTSDGVCEVEGAGLLDGHVRSSVSTSTSPGNSPPGRGAGAEAAVAVPVMGEGDGELEPQACNGEGGVWRIVRREAWLLTCLSLVGFLVNCQPSEPYLAKYLMEDKNLSSASVESYVWPYYTYSYFVWLLPVGFCADALGYRPVIFFGLLCRQATRVLLLYASGLWPMSLMQVTYAGATAVDTVYFAYAFLAAPADAAPVAVSAMYAMHSLGNVCGSLLGQALVGGGTPVRALFYYSWAFSTAGLLWFAVFFPSPRGKGAPDESVVGIVRREGAARAFACVARAYTSRQVRLWSVWWVFAYSAYSVVTNYYENEYYEIDPNGAFGASESAMEAVRMVGCLLPALAPHWAHTKSLSLVIATSAASAALLYGSTRTRSLAVAVVCNALYMGVFGATQAAAEISVSRSLRLMGQARYSVVFAANTFTAAGLAVVLLRVLAAYEAGTAVYYYVCAALNVVLCVVGAAWLSGACVRGEV